MKDSIRSSLESLQEKANSLSNKLSDPSITSDISKLTNLNKEFAEIKDVVENWSEYQNTEKTLADLENLLNCLLYTSDAADDGLCVLWGGGGGG